MNWSLEAIRKHRRPLSLVAGLALGLFGLLAALALVSYDATDNAWGVQRGANGPPANWIGIFGATASEWLLQAFGTAAFLVPVACLIVGWDRLGERGSIEPAHLLSGTAAFAALAVLIQLLFRTIGYGGEAFPAGGHFGEIVGGLLQALLARPGALLVATTLLAATVVFTARQSFLNSGHILRSLVAQRWNELRERWAAWREARNERAEAQAAANGSDVEPETPAVADVEPRPSIAVEEPEEEDEEALPQPAPLLKKPAPPPKPAAPVQQPLPMEGGEPGYALPPMELLREPEPQSIESEQELLDRAKQITAKLKEFNVGGTVVAVHPGPVVTTFEFKPDAGVKYSKITGMTDDLSLALKAESVRIARMPQKSTVGIEVPNRRKETIFPREIIGAEVFRDTESKLPLALGKDITGEAFVTALDKMPHLLIAGATGAGKSVGLNTMIVSLLFRATPRDLRFIMIDTKMIELGIYADIPHLLIPVVTEAKHAAAALKWAVKEMENRYRRLAAVGVRNLTQFNELLEAEPDRTMLDPRTGEEVVLTHLPYIVIVIDEMADLMMIASSEVEEAIMRLAQMARAVGIHLILATQRPSVDVITGTIKANFPSRIAYRVSQRVDSRTIIDQQGAEHLLGRGDMLFLATGASRVTRLHGPFITESEINRITSFLKKMADPIYDETVLKEPDERGGTTDPGEFDEMYYDAVRTVLQEGKCSITLIQRRLQLGYARAARIVDMMEQQGVVGPGEGSKPREILVGADYLEALEASAH